MPPVIRRWMSAKTTSEGSVARNAAAASGPRSATPSAPMKWVRTTGRVCFSGVFRSTSAKKNSFHAVMNANSAVATMPGASSGAVTETSVRTRPAPSTAAASSSSGGTARTYPASIHSANGSAHTTYTSTRPGTELIRRRFFSTRNSGMISRTNGKAWLTTTHPVAAFASRVRRRAMT